MARSAVLIERAGNGIVDSLTNSLICTKRKEGSFSLQLRRSGGDGHRRRTIALGIRCPREFVEALLSVTQRSELVFEDYEIADEICARLRGLDADFADAVEETVFLRCLALHLQGGRASPSVGGRVAAPFQAS